MEENISTSTCNNNNMRVIVSFCLSRLGLVFSLKPLYLGASLSTMEYLSSVSFGIEGGVESYFDSEVGDGFALTKGGDIFSGSFWFNDINTSFLDACSSLIKGNLSFSFCFMLCRFGAVKQRVLSRAIPIRNRMEEASHRANDLPWEFSRTGSRLRWCMNPIDYSDSFLAGDL